MKQMNIGQLAKRTGVPAKTIRYYEEVGLLPQPQRAPNGYRVYAPRSADVLSFIKRSRELGFSVDEVAALLALWEDADRSSAEVRALAEQHLASVEQKIAELQSMRATLLDLVHRCHGDDRPDCPILDDLSSAYSHADHEPAARAIKKTPMKDAS